MTRVRRDYMPPHAFERKGWRVWLCRWCMAPRSLHPRRCWARLREPDNNRYLSADAPHFTGDW